MEIKKINIIIADDHPVYRFGLYSLLQTLPLAGKIQQAANGREVISLLNADSFDIVLMDIRMKPMDGISTTAQVTQRYHAKVIGLSMFSDRRYVLDMIHNGACGYLLKNAETEEIVTALETVMAGGTYFSEQLRRLIEKERPEKTKRLFTSHEEKLRQIMYLLCLEKTSKEIADIMCLSKRTIDEYRQEIADITSSKNLAGVIKYAIENDILDDEVIHRRLFPDSLK